MIISASRRTDIPAFYAEWFMNRIRAGYCSVPNPFRASQVSRVALTPDRVEVIVFWTRNPKPIMKDLAELDDRGFRYYFQYTVMGDHRLLHPKSLPLEDSVHAFQELADRLGPKRVIWRYDPIVLSNLTPCGYHLERFAQIANALKSYTQRSVISFVDMYKTIANRMKHLEESGLRVEPCEGAQLGELARALVAIAKQNGMRLVSCAEELDLRPYGVAPGKCMDDDLIAELFGLPVTRRKDPSQRKACGCVLSKDIGMYDTCSCNCVYCYATRSPAHVERNRKRHDPKSPSLVDWLEPTPPRNPGCDIG